MSTLTALSPVSKSELGTRLALVPKLDIERFFVRKPFPPKVPFEELTDLQQSILINIANSIARDGVPRHAKDIAKSLSIHPNTISKELMKLKRLEYVRFPKHRSWELKLVIWKD